MVRQSITIGAYAQKAIELHYLKDSVPAISQKLYKLLSVILMDPPCHIFIKKIRHYRILHKQISFKILLLMECFTETGWHYEFIKASTLNDWGVGSQALRGPQQRSHLAS